MVATYIFSIILAVFPSVEMCISSHVPSRKHLITFRFTGQGRP